MSKLTAYHDTATDTWAIEDEHDTVAHLWYLDEETHQHFPIQEDKAEWYAQEIARRFNEHDNLRRLLTLAAEELLSTSYHTIMRGESETLQEIRAALQIPVPSKE